MATAVNTPPTATKRVESPKKPLNEAVNPFIATAALSVSLAVLDIEEVVDLSIAD
ncbi:hypothetical protein WHU00_27790 (plasmid) [Escherichia coli]|uniref:hypothetical protein n=1 Tax=Escherichia coli TaxID=562 RepID=UPI0030CD29CE